MARTWSDLQPPKDFDPRHVELWKKLNLQMRDFSSGVGQISRGYTPDGSGNPLVSDDGRFFLLKGRPFGQQAHGAVEASGSLTLSSTYNSTKGNIYFGTAEGSVYDELNNRVGVGTTIPDAPLHVIGEPTGSPTIYRPAATVATAVRWTSRPDGSTTNYHTALSDNSDTTYVDNSPISSGTMILRFAPITDPGASFHAGWLLRIRASFTVDTGSTESITWSLWNGGTSIAGLSGSQTFTGTGIVTKDITLLTAGVDLITAWSDLQLNLTAGGGVTVPRIYDVWIEVPPTGSGYSDSAQTVIIEPYAAGYEAVQFVATGLNAAQNDMRLFSPATSSDPWRLQSGSGFGFSFSDFDQVTIEGKDSNTAGRLELGNTFGTSITLWASDTGGTPYGNLDLIGIGTFTAVDASLEQGTILVYPGDTTPGIVVLSDEAGGQTANAFECYTTSSGTAAGRAFAVASNGLVSVFPKALTVNASTHLRPKTAGSKVLIVQGTTTQTASLQEWQNVSDVALLTVTAAGRFTVESGGTMRFVPGAGAGKMFESNASGDISLVTIGGDVTQSGGTFTIGNDKVTYAKMQNVSAASKLLGRGSASGSGDVEEITLGTGLTMTGTTLSASGGATDHTVNVFIPASDWAQVNGSTLVLSTENAGTYPDRYKYWGFTDAPATKPQALNAVWNVPVNFKTGSSVTVHVLLTTSTASDNPVRVRYHYNPVAIPVEGDWTAQEDLGTTTSGVYTTVAETTLDFGMASDLPSPRFIYWADFIARHTFDTAMTGLAAGDFVNIVFDRDTDNDAYGGTVRYLGMILSYTADTYD
jgi:hypothetical protein